MNSIKEQYILAWNFIKNKLLKIFLIILSVFILLQICSAFFLISNEDMTYQMVEQFRQAFKDEMGTEGIDMFFMFIQNNTTASVLAIVVGFIPFLFLPIFNLFINSLSVGVVYAFAYIQDISIINTIIFGLLPHGIFEITAYLLSITMGIYLCLTISRRIDSKEEKGSILLAIINICRTIFTIVLPFLIIAAVIETYITPILLEMFL